MRYSHADLFVDLGVDEGIYSILMNELKVKATRDHDKGSTGPPGQCTCFGRRRLVVPSNHELCLALEESTTFVEPADVRHSCNRGSRASEGALISGFPPGDASLNEFVGHLLRLAWVAVHKGAFQDLAVPVAVLIALRRGISTFLTLKGSGHIGKLLLRLSHTKSSSGAFPASKGPYCCLHSSSPRHRR